MAGARRCKRLRRQCWVKEFGDEVGGIQRLTGRAALGHWDSFGADKIVAISTGR
ncbi:MAG TPA: hypothetical protein VFX16_21185 [Pseudonocardiaceae bacterium]|nr:hypothetical protein [Pseudonocardiaceae bacterium]